VTTGWKIGVGSALLLLIGGILLYQLLLKEPRYQGKTLSEWLAMAEMYLPNTPSDAPPEKQREKQLEIIAAVQHMGKRALPRLFEMLHAEDSPPRQKIIEFVNENTVFKLPPDVPAEKLKSRAVIGLAALRDQQAELIIPHVREELKKAEPAGDVIELLAVMGTNGLPTLLLALTNKSPHIRWSAAGALAYPYYLARETNAALLSVLAACGYMRNEIQNNCKVYQAAAVVPLLGCLNDAHPGVQRAAADSLDEMGTRPTNAIPIYAALLQAVDAHDRRNAAWRLSHFGSAAKEAVPILLQLLKDGDETVPTAARHALKEIDPGALEDEPLMNTNGR
jgi:HEAT repeat protein